MMLKLSFFIGLLLMTMTINAQEKPATIEPALVEVEAVDGDQPAVLLLHQLYTTRASWNPVINSLLESGYKVLAVDLRGYGQTRGSINWIKAQDDVIRWVEWLNDQAGVTSVSIIGSSMGSSLALTGCASSECAGVIAVSPGLNYFKVSTNDAIQAGFPVFIVYADHDTYPARDVPAMTELAGENVTLQTYAGRTHGVALFKEHEDLLPLVIDWLNNHR
jgi:alpha-beta hydrolase superfamily lysophospholipase